MTLCNDRKLKNLRRALRKNQTEAERKIWQHLRKKQIGGYRFLRQYSIGKYILDFYCPTKKLAIEIDGGQHFEDKKEHDLLRKKFLKAKGIKEIRFWNSEIFKNIEGVLIEIRRNLGMKE